MAKKFLDNTGLSHLIDLIQGMPDDQTIGYTTEAGLHVLDGGITPDKISSLQQLRYEMGLGNTLGALPIENGGTGLTSEAAIKEWLESLLDLSGGGGGEDQAAMFSINRSDIRYSASRGRYFPLNINSTMNNFQLADNYKLTALVSGNYSYNMSVSNTYGGTLELRVNGSAVASCENPGQGAGSDSGNIYIASNSSVELWYANLTTTSSEYETTYSLTLIKQ